MQGQDAVGVAGRDRANVDRPAVGQHDVGLPAGRVAGGARGGTGLAHGVQAIGASEMVLARALATMSARVKLSRWRRMVSPTSAHRASKTHWPS